MKTERQKFRETLKEIPDEAFEDIKNLLLEKYNIQDIEVSNITLKPLANPTQAECISKGKELFCRRYKNGVVRCWCI
jgi:hypothetical protein